MAAGVEAGLRSQAARTGMTIPAKARVARERVQVVPARAFRAPAAAPVGAEPIAVTDVGFIPGTRMLDSAYSYFAFAECAVASAELRINRSECHYHWW
jgi:hypothetical protein